MLCINFDPSRYQSPKTSLKLLRPGWGDLFLEGTTISHPAGEVGEFSDSTQRSPGHCPSNGI